MKQIILITCLLVLTPLLALASDRSSYPQYLPAKNISGSINAVGSETLEPLVRLWGEKFKTHHPSVEIFIEAKGSATAPPALISGNTNLAAMSRKMTGKEVVDFEAKFRYKPVFFRVALDALSVYVNENNPLKGLTLKQLDGIFSSTQSCGGDDISNWGALVFGSLATRPIHLYGRDALSGTHAYFKRKALCGGEFKSDIRIFRDQNDVISAVANNEAGIGYCGLGCRRSGVKVLALARHDDDAFVPYYLEKYKDDPDPMKRHATVVSGKYPLSRFLYIYVNKPSKAKLPLVVEKFLRLVLSTQGQQVVEEAGYIPLPGKILRRQLKKLEAGYVPRWWLID